MVSLDGLHLVCCWHLLVSYIAGQQEQQQQLGHGVLRGEAQVQTRIQHQSCFLHHRKGSVGAHLQKLMCLIAGLVSWLEYLDQTHARVAGQTGVAGSTGDLDSLVESVESFIEKRRAQRHHGISIRPGGTCCMQLPPYLLGCSLNADSDVCLAHTLAAAVRAKHLLCSSGACCYSRELAKAGLGCRGC